MAFRQCTARSWCHVRSHLLRWQPVTTRRHLPLQAMRALSTANEMATADISNKKHDPAAAAAGATTTTPTTLATELDFSKPLDAVWEDYCYRVDHQEHLTFHDFNILCARIKKETEEGPDDAIRRLQSAMREMHRRKMPKEVFIRGCNMLVHLFIQKKDLKSARLVVDGMMRSNYRPDEVTVKTLFGGVMEVGGSISDLHDIYETLQERRMFPEVSSVYQMLISMFGSRGLIDSARTYYAACLKKRIPLEPGVFNQMMLAYGTAELPEAALGVYQQMVKRGCQPTGATYHIIITLLQQAGMKEAMDHVFDDMKASGVAMNTSHFIACGWDPKQAIEELHRLDNTLSTRDYNTCIAHYIKRNQFPEALEVFRMMNEKGVDPDVYSFSIIMDTIARDRERPVDQVFAFHEEMKSHDIQPDVSVYTTLMAACTRTDGGLDKAMGLLSEMEQHNVMPNTFTFNAIFSLLSQQPNVTRADYERAEQLWNKMNQLGIKPDTRSYNTQLAILSRLVKPVDDEQHADQLWKTDGRNAFEMSGAAKEMLQLYRSMRKRCKRDFITYTTVINTLVSAGQIRQAMQVYDDAKIARIRLPISVYNSTMKALKQANQISQIMNIWHDMKSMRVRPDNNTYTYALDACLQLGLRESFSAIRAQRRDDADRLLELERKREERMQSKKEAAATVEEETALE